MPRGVRPIVALLVACAMIAGGAAAWASGRGTVAAVPQLTDWPEFGLNPQRSDATDQATGITSANVRDLRERTVVLPGTVDSSAIYLHDAEVDGARHDVVIVTTDYGITLAIDANSGRILWRFTPPGISAWEGSAQIMTASPITDGGYVYAGSPNGLVHKLSLADGKEAAGWPARITLAPKTEKFTPSLNIADGYLLAGTGGYIGDIPPYIGHLVAISLATGRIAHVFNTLCANHAAIVEPPTCSASDSAILSRSGPVVEPGGRAVLITTGNAPYNGSTDFGDSLIELTLPGLTFRQAYTPTDQAMLNADDVDFGSGSPALLPGDLVLTGGKDGLLRLLDLAALDGRRPGTRPVTGGDLQDLVSPAGQQLFTAPAVSGDSVFVADGGGTSGSGPGGTAAYRLSGERLHLVWQNDTAGTSPILAGGLLYVYDPNGDGIAVYNPDNGARITVLHAPAGHWNSPIVVDDHLIEPTGNDNNHLTTGSLEIFSTP